ncbi:uncharacterized protein LOC121771689 [Salvia splendens]|uniref:uncharacterized protein LOC121771689 n=1 Tax=Salvia splendens TaxID=180675 RepID=UPI001C277098|nr:uncharacterized protein LOC121771689 [Salvia splendens]
MSSSSQTSNFNHFWPEGDFVICNHGVRAEIGTSRTDNNPGRRFYRCPSWKSDDCKFFRWIEPTSPLSREILLNRTNKEMAEFAERWRCAHLKAVSLEEELNAKIAEFNDKLEECNAKIEECEMLKSMVEDLGSTTLKLKLLIFLLCVVIFFIM